MRSLERFDLKKSFLCWRMYLLAVVVALLWCVPPLLVEQVPGEPFDLASLEDTYRRTLAQILGGVGLLYGLYLGWRRVRAVEEGQITERFTQAIAQLGDDKMAIRLGGIYALERIAKDSEKDHGPIMEVLTAYVRENAPRQEQDPQNCAKKPPTDIQAILTVIGRRKTTDIKRLDDFLDLTNTHLAGITLYKADLSGANLSRARLHGVNLSGAGLHGINLSGALLIGVDLHEAGLSRADLHEANLIGAKKLTEEQVREAENWEEAILPDYLKYLLTPVAG